MTYGLLVALVICVHGLLFHCVIFDAMVLRMYVLMVENALLSQSLPGSLAKKYIK